MVYCDSVINSAKKSVDSVILKLAPCPGVKSATKLLDVLAHYSEHQHPWGLQEGSKAGEGEGWETVKAIRIIKLLSQTLLQVK